MTLNYRKPYKVETEKGGDTVESHESFGLMSISRTSGSAGKLFGSHVDLQQSYFTLTVSQAERIHGLSHDWFHPRGQIVEIHMTAAQFAEAITSLNMGAGVPCTIHRVLHDTMEPVPHEMETEAKKIRSSFKDDVKGLASKLIEGSKKVDELLEKKSLTVAEKNEIRGLFSKAIMDVRENLPFIVESFQESTEKIATQAKAEVDAFVQMGLHKLGLEALGKRMASGEKPLAALGSGKPDDE